MVAHTRCNLIKKLQRVLILLMPYNFFSRSYQPKTGYLMGVIDHYKGLPAAR